MNIIYRITCVKNGKYYIGSTVNKRQRWARHRKDLRAGVHKNKNMQASWNKYGEDAFTFEVCEEVADMAQLMAVEQRYLDACVGAADCFNHNKWADSPWRGKSGEGTPNWGRKMTPEAVEKNRRAHSGPLNANYGKKTPPEVVEKIRASNFANPNKHAPHTPEAVAKIAAAGRGRPQSALTRAKRIVSMQGHEVSTLTRMKISQALMGENNPRYGKPREAGFAEKVSKVVIATSPDGTATTYTSITALREALGLKPPTVNRALKAGTPLVRGPYAGWSFRYM